MWFLAASALAGGFVFREALLTRALLAPLDLAPALYWKYRFVDPAQRPVPRNHHTVDQLLYDLPQQQLVHESYRQGVIPWWDPYSLGGRPFLADAHLNGTDPVRVVVYRLLPFESAYNWTRIVHTLLAGLGMWLLLRHWRFHPWVCGGLALAYQFSGFQALFFGLPWIPASFLYYPYLWLAWERVMEQSARGPRIMGALLVAAVLYAGSIQTHSYLVLFTLAFAVGHGGLSPDRWRRQLPVVVGTGLLGAGLAAPVLLNQLELFWLSTRTIPVAARPLDWLGGLVSLGAAVFPWAMGTFRSLDVGKFFGENSLGFFVFAGSVVTVLAGLGVWAKPTVGARPAWQRTALVLVIIYVVVMSTPLRAIFYPRCAGLAVMGLVVLAAVGVEHLWASPHAWKRGGMTLLALTGAGLLALNALALLVYPRLIPRVDALVQQHLATARGAPTLGDATELRQFQVRNLPQEVSLRNPETVLAALGLIGLGGVMLRPGLRCRGWVLPTLLALNLLPLLLFSARFIPRHPMTLWERLREGGPEQQYVAAALNPDELRLLDVEPDPTGKLFPKALQHLYRVRTVHGYAGLWPRCLDDLSPAEQQQHATRLADYRYYTEAPDRETGTLVRTDASGRARFQWLDSPERSVRSRQVSPNAIRLEIGEGPSGRLLWTDTHYPGWRAMVNGSPLRLGFHPPCFTLLHVPPGSVTVALEYRPRFLNLGLAVAGACLLMLALGLVQAQRRHDPTTSGSF